MHLVTLKKTFGHTGSKVPNWQEKTDKKATIELRFIARKFKKNFSKGTFKNYVDQISSYFDHLPTSG